jgi:dienelactone hydrolase
VRVTYPSPVRTPWPENDTVPCELYLPRRAAGKVPAAVVLDILDGSALVARALACGLADRGVAALYVPMACYGARRPAGGAHYRYYADHPEKTADNLRQTVMDVRRGKAVLAALPEVDAGRIGITGVSLGGITASLAAGVDGTFHRVIPILAGGDVAAICFHARETRRIREACRAKGITQPMLSAMLKPVEP